MFVALLPSGGWYIKNLNQYGFCGASSWYGLGWFKTAASMYTHEDLNRLKHHGVIDDWALKDPYQGEVPDAIHLFPPSGTGVAILNRMDFHHASIPQLSRAYAVNALQLIRHQPSMYLRAVHDGYVRFCRPSSTFHHLDPLRGLLFWEGGYNLLFSGQGIVRSTIPIGWSKPDSMIYFIFPVLIVAGCLYFIRGIIRLRTTGSQSGRETGSAGPYTLGYMLFTMLYTVMAGCLFENGENVRFRFPIETLMLITTLVLLQRFFVGIRKKNHV